MPYFGCERCPDETSSLEDNSNAESCAGVCKTSNESREGRDKETLRDRKATYKCEFERTCGREGGVCEVEGEEDAVGLGGVRWFIELLSARETTEERSLSEMLTE